MIKLKEDRKLRREIVKVGRGELLGSTSKSSASLVGRCVGYLIHSFTDIAK